MLGGGKSANGNRAAGKVSGGKSKERKRTKLREKAPNNGQNANMGAIKPEFAIVIK